MAATELSLQALLAVEPGCAALVWSIPPQALGPVEVSAPAEVSDLPFAIPAASLRIEAVRRWPCRAPAGSPNRAGGT